MAQSGAAQAISSKISYGIYIWHYFVGRAISSLDPVPFEEHSIGACIALVVGSFAASILIAEISWRAIEQPALRFKRRSEAFLHPAPVSGPRVGGLVLRVVWSMIDGFR